MNDKTLKRVLGGLKVRQLQLLVSIKQFSSIQRAANNLQISQPAASKLVKDLEDDFGVPLFERTNRGVNPTLYGEALLRHAQLILTQISRAAHEMDDLSHGKQGQIVIGTLLAASALILPRAIAGAAVHSPSLSVKVVEGTHDVLMPALRQGRIDMIVGHLPSHRFRGELVQEKLCDEQTIAVTRVGHPLLRRRNFEFAELMQFGWILPPQDTTLRRQIERVFLERHSALPENIVESVSYVLNRELMANTDMIGVFPSHVAERDLRGKMLAHLKGMPHISRNAVGISYRIETTISPAGEVFIAELRKAAAQLTRVEVA